VHDLAQAECQVGGEMHGRDHVQHRQPGHVSHHMRTEIECGRRRPGLLEHDIGEVIADQFANARAGVDMRNDLDREIRLGKCAQQWDADIPGLPAILVKPKTIADAYKLRQQYRSGSTLAVFPAEVLTRLYATLGDAKRVLFAVAAGSQALVAASLLLVTVMHVGQRRRQIGALRAFGAPRRALFSIVWLELFVLVAFGIALGFGLGYAAALAISGVMSEGSGVIMPVGFGREDLGFAGALIGFAAVISAAPAVLAYRQSPAAALRN
jgi:putative ABC transport system permease protein